MTRVPACMPPLLPCLLHQTPASPPFSAGLVAASLASSGLRPRSASVKLRITFAGVPTTTLQSGISRVTVEPLYMRQYAEVSQQVDAYMHVSEQARETHAPIVQPRPIVTPAMMVQLPPTHVSRPMAIGSARSKPASRSGSAVVWVPP